MTDSDVRGNRRAGVAVDGATLTLENVEFEFNEVGASLTGVAIGNFRNSRFLQSKKTGSPGIAIDGSRLDIQSSVIASNTGDGIKALSNSDITIKNSLIEDNSGAGIELAEFGTTVGSDLTIEDSLIQGNSETGINSTIAREKDLVIRNTGIYQTAQKTPSFRSGMDSARGEAALYT